MHLSCKEQASGFARASERGMLVAGALSGPFLAEYYYRVLLVLGSFSSIPCWLLAAITSTIIHLIAYLGSRFFVLFFFLLRLVREGSPLCGSGFGRGRAHLRFCIAYAFVGARWSGPYLRF